LEQLFLAQAILWRQFGHSFFNFEKNLRGSPHKIPTLFFESRSTLGHLVPDATEGVVGKEFNNIARREELGANGQLTTISRRASFPHLLSFSRVVVILINPTDRLILGPEHVEVWSVEKF